MYQFLNDIVNNFRSCFKTKKAFGWFVFVILAIIVRQDNDGVTSMIRAFGLNDQAYEALLYFFYYSPFALADIHLKWDQVVRTHCPCYKVSGRVVLVGDGYNHSVEGKRMPCVGSLHDSSNNNKRPGSFLGQFFGGLGVIAGSAKDCLCLPLRFSIQKNHEEVLDWMGKPTLGHGEQLLADAFEAAGELGKAFLVLDRFFLSHRLLTLYNFLEEKSPDLVKLVVRCKKNIVGYTEPKKRKGRGRPRKKGDKVVIGDLFDGRTPEMPDPKFKTRKLKLYGKTEEVRVGSVKLIWSTKIYQRLRFVLAEYGSHRLILATTDFVSAPEKIVELYALRFKIEHCFKTFANVFGGLAYHFWTKALEKIRRGKKASDILKEVTGPKDRDKIIRAYRRTEVYTTFAVIAMGITQLLCLKFKSVRGCKKILYFRTKKQNRPSEREMRAYLNQNIMSFVQKEPDRTISKIILRLRGSYLAYPEAIGKWQKAA